MDTSYSNKEKLKSKKLIEKMFVEGRSISAFPLRLVYLKTHFNDGVTIKTGVSVSKRHFKSAIDRNRIKRLMREAYRLNKPIYFNNFSTQCAFMILYIGNEKPTFEEVDKAMKQLLEKVLKKVS
ncbi:ribonuclease P protein component [Flavobacteriaceae bacterium S0825]|uniref:ribonuclease P protein component n=1 Tax=Gaetbulibacter sp. S0825 TaxID=2720084 RepID=UPI00142FFD3F|nr:ribonuclease P protein component [Gaetbulibacter sp. S0825]MCK0108244.1 ribonuclease P protein component [Flavobacteriaceae bacterium S0825]NIX63880.1 ribonuclease P protein component [Gaetbulibacter sp. S0825]